jgi:hypothetical protein
MLERIPCADWISISTGNSGREFGKLTFANERACSNNRETDPQTVHNTA